MSLCVMRSAVAAVMTAMALAACSTPTPPPAPVTPEPTRAAAIPSAAQAAQAFVNAVNADDFEAALGLLDPAARGRVGDAAGLRREYLAARETATGSSATYAPRGLLQTGNRAEMALASTWQTSIFGPINVTATLPLAFADGVWRVTWTRDAVLQGLESGTLFLQHDVPPRGAILASDGSTLAGLQALHTIGVQPGLVADAQEETALLNDLAQLTGLKSAEIRAKYSGKPADWFIPVAEVNEETLNANRELVERHDAVSTKRRLVRAYPQPTLATHVTGYVSPIPPEALADYRARGFGGDESIGAGGVEASMNDVLMGRPGGTLQLLTQDRRLITIADKQFDRGRDVMLTISPTVQAMTQQLLGQTRNRGAAIVMDAKTGAVLAMASYPSFDLSVFANPLSDTERLRLINNPQRPLLNRAVQGQYPPGSSFKPVTMAAGIGEKVTSPNDVFNDPGYWDGLGPGFRKTCWLSRGHGRITLQDGLTASCNTVFYQVGKELQDKNPAALGAYAKGFGFGSRTGIELPGEAAGTAPDPAWKQRAVGQPWVPGDTVNMAIGQGYMLATPLQIAQMTEGIASGGKLIRPRLVQAIGLDGEPPEWTFTPQISGTLPATAAAVRAMRDGMIGVTTNRKIGTAEYRFAGFDYYMAGDRIVPGKALSAAQKRVARPLVVAGKTGTAQSPNPSDKPFAWFTSFVPADDPQIVVTTMLENIGEGSSYAAPLARQIIEAYFGLPVANYKTDNREGD